MPVTTRQEGDQDFQQAVDDPEQLVQRGRMAVLQSEQHVGADPIPWNVDEVESTNSETDETPSRELYLPDLNNTPLSKAITRGISWGTQGEVIMECQDLMPIFGVDTLLVNPLTGKTKLYDKGVIDSFPVDCTMKTFQLSLLNTLLETAATQCARPLELPLGN